MHEILEWLKPETIIREGGVFLLIFVIFAETGLFVGFFLPGDSLLFVSGLLCSSTDLISVHVSVLILSLIAAAILGNLTGYLFGYKVGPALFKRDDSWLFKKKYVDMTKSFYERHGGRTIVLGRFLPIIRTFAPILAGVIQMRFSAFLTYTIIGALLWIPTFTIMGYVLGTNAWVKSNLTIIVLSLIIITLIPVFTTYLKERKLQKNAKKED